MHHIGWVNLVGYTASLLVFCTFYMKTMIPLRAIAIASNLAFMTYGLAGRLYPVFLLHVVLFPLNFLRLRQTRTLIRRARNAAQGNLSLEWLLPLMTRQRFAAGHVLFRISDEARYMCLVLAGSVRVVEAGVILGPGSVVGEIGLFAPDNRRSGTVVCQTDVEIGSITDDRVLQLYYQNPTFGLYLMRLVVGRMLENERRRLADPHPRLLDISGQREQAPGATPPR